MGWHWRHLAVRSSTRGGEVLVSKLSFPSIPMAHSLPKELASLKNQIFRWNFDGDVSRLIEDQQTFRYNLTIEAFLHRDQGHGDILPSEFHITADPFPFMLIEPFKREPLSTIIFGALMFPVWIAVSFNTTCSVAVTSP